MRLTGSPVRPVDTAAASLEKPALSLFPQSLMEKIVSRPNIDSPRRTSKRTAEPLAPTILLCRNFPVGFALVGKRSDDKQVLKLFGRYLRAGVIVQGVFQPTIEGTPQGGPASPLRLVVNLETSRIVPSSEVEYLGFVFPERRSTCRTNPSFASNIASAR